MALYDLQATATAGSCSTPCEQVEMSAGSSCHVLEEAFLNDDPWLLSIASCKDSVQMDQYSAVPEGYGHYGLHGSTSALLLNCPLGSPVRPPSAGPPAGQFHGPLSAKARKDFAPGGIISAPDFKPPLQPPGMEAGPEKQQVTVLPPPFGYLKQSVAGSFGDRGETPPPPAPAAQVELSLQKLGNSWRSAAELAEAANFSEGRASALREMIYRVSAMQPVNIDPSTISRPKRRNVRISKDPQSVAARHRRERISDRIRILQRLVPGGTKMDTASMLDEAIHYVKFLKKQVQVLESAAIPSAKYSYPQACRSLDGTSLAALPASLPLLNPNFESTVANFSKYSAPPRPSPN